MELAEGRYRLEEELGAGGAATVFRAWDRVLEVPRAVKVLRSGRSQPELRQRMIAEARAMARIDHPNVLRVYDVGADGDVDFVVMDLAEGGTLADRLVEDGPLPPIRVLQYAIQVLSALAAAHSAGIVHRDVKPHNILLDREGTALLADFGIALIADQRGTRTGTAMGSLQFMAPEQRMDARQVGPAADLYATGASMYALLTARNPVDLFTAGPDSERFLGLDPGMVGLLRTATAFDLSERYPNARAMGQDVLRLLKDAGEEPLRPPDPATPTAFPMPSDSLKPKPTRRRSTMVPPPPSSEAVEAAIGFLTEGVGDLGTLDPTVQYPQGTSAGDPDEDRPPAMGWWPIPLVAMALLLVAWVTQGPAPTAPPEPVPEAAPRPVPAGPAPAPIVAPAPEPAPATPEPVTPAPAAVAPAPAPSMDVVPGGPPPLGRWTGSLNGIPATLVLRGSFDALEGSLDVRSGGNTVHSPVRGSFDPVSGALVLEDQVEGDDAGTYTATLTSGRLEGRFTYRNLDRIVPFVLTR